MKKIFALILFIFNTSLWAQAVPVKIEKIKGKVLYYRAQTMSILTERSELKNDDLVMTKDGSISLIFEDTTISLSPHSLFRVMNIKNKERYQFGEFLMGEYSSVTRKKLVDKRRLEVILPKAKVHVVGTRFIIQIAPNVEQLMERQKGKEMAAPIELPRLELIPTAVSSPDLVTQVTCFEGKVFVETDSGQKKQLEYKESALYSGNGANLRVTMKDEAELESMASALAFEIIDSKAIDSNPSESTPSQESETE
ncbi:MAG: hypothetical protein COW01_02100 [Bdellovibrionales bacterium CG12_big_fil_rev_8_21_14_0_65_38_15]|nr:MAG: hypothetical protein COW79_02335 [Bdellovibrionales bacterium CG22_combo_CG10-13_8_21_14_all_38_13]PIQ57098.1 MAG: hypothetical protein COW01_02100 [Bdellovibrionales bacterium CG12_big_fil_rev_8_21_14_0_65_38_15]PIR30128.1 MAG: hypothetical protein COV38_07495 [Bdellovibrionales bacterium CG11_big_fil_rev_8_21_14_0_20_38_13]